MFRAALVASVLFAWVASAAAQDGPPAWAYPVNPPDLKLAPDDGTPRQVPDSTASYTLTQIRDLFVAPDWHPGDHPPFPEVVGRGRKPEVRACAVCHRAGGTGGPENASIAGLPDGYIIQQMADYKSGARTTAVPQRSPVRLMIATAKAATDAEVKEAAAYFSALKLPSNIKVVEADTVPTSYIFGWHMAAATSGTTEPLGERILEVPDNLEQFESRDSRARFTAYVPPGSVEKGRLLAAGGNGSRPPCAVCHGADLKGLGPIPGLAGRSPTYIVRQLYDFKHGARTGAWSALMAPAVEHLAVDDMIALAAYAASLSE
jgi:cytochrome c553